MKKIFISFWIFSSFIALNWSCKPKEEVISIEKVEGLVQKGPFTSGSTLQISELNAQLNPTGKVFNSQIENNQGFFTVKSLNLVSKYVETTTNGFYYDEVKGKKSDAPLTLNALVDITNSSNLNVNVLSHLERQRMKFLIEKGSTFENAKKQAQKEVLAIFSILKPDIANSETLNIAQNKEDNAILLAISVILQGTHSVADLTELMANIGNDIKEDGILTDAKLGSALINGVKFANLTQIRKNVEDRYKELGVTTVIPNFEKYVQYFIANTKYSYTFNGNYPVSTPIGLNVLAFRNELIFNNQYTYSLAAIVPENGSLKIKIRNTYGAAWGISLGSLNGWTMNTFNSQREQTFTATAVGRLIDLAIIFDGEGSAYVDFYENSDNIVTKSIFLTWKKFAKFNFPTNGAFGQNLLALPYSNSLKSGVYSVAANMADDQPHNVGMTIWEQAKGSDFSIDKAKMTNWTYEEVNENGIRKIYLNLKGTKLNADLPITLGSKGGQILIIADVDAKREFDFEKKIGW